MNPDLFPWYVLGVRFGQAREAFVGRGGSLGALADHNAPLSRAVLYRLCNAVDGVRGTPGVRHVGRIDDEITDAEAALKAGRSTGWSDPGQVRRVRDSLGEAFRTVKEQLRGKDADAFRLGYLITLLEPRHGRPGGPEGESCDVDGRPVRPYHRRWRSSKIVRQLLESLQLRDADVMPRPEQWSPKVRQRLGELDESSCLEEFLDWLNIEEGIVRLEPKSETFEVDLERLVVRIGIEVIEEIPVSEPIAVVFWLLTRENEITLSRTELGRRALLMGRSLPERLDRAIAKLDPRLQPYISSNSKGYRFTPGPHGR